jgi:hypothetical protein
MDKRIETLKKLVGDDDLLNKAIELSNKPKVRPSNIHGKNNYIYTLPHVELHSGLDLINKSLKKPSNNMMIFFNDKNNSTIIKKLYELLEDDNEDKLLVSLIILQTEKEKKINFNQTKLDF